MDKVIEEIEELEALKDTDDKIYTAQYAKVFESLSLLKEILTMSESDKSYIKMLGYRDDTKQVQCMVSNVVG
ncbi:hypothetical protein L4D20_12810 [Vibrio kyushuensis]|uniref:hypothetical protein n=1 Tax=Vibrio kyushuensis TaxID=2910249 RepID=UPI003D09EC71